MSVPPWVEFDPDDDAFRRDFEAAYQEADIGSLPAGGSEAARRVALVLQRKREQACSRSSMTSRARIGWRATQRRARDRSQTIDD